MTHYYSEMVTAHPLSWTQTWACGGPFLSGVASKEEAIPKEQLGECSGPRAEGGTIQKCKYNTGNSSQVRPLKIKKLKNLKKQKHPTTQQGWCKSAPTWPEVAPNLQPPVPSISRAEGKKADPGEGGDLPTSVPRFCSAKVGSPGMKSCAVCTASLDARGSRILTKVPLAQAPA